MSEERLAQNLSPQHKKITGRNSYLRQCSPYFHQRHNDLHSLVSEKKLFLHSYFSCTSTKLSNKRQKIFRRLWLRSYKPGAEGTCCHRPFPPEALYDAWKTDAGSWENLTGKHTEGAAVRRGNKAKSPLLHLHESCTFMITPPAEGGADFT